MSDKIHILTASLLAAGNQRTDLNFQSCRGHEHDETGSHGSTGGANSEQ